MPSVGERANGFNRIETPLEAYSETYFADSSLGLDLYFN